MDINIKMMGTGKISQFLEINTAQLGCKYKNLEFNWKFYFLPNFSRPIIYK